MSKGSEEFHVCVRVCVCVRACVHVCARAHVCGRARSFVCNQVTSMRQGSLNAHIRIYTKTP